MRSSFQIVLLIACAIPASSAQSAPLWDPQKTYVLVASVIEWPPKAGLAPFTSERRRDEDLVNQFRKSGVPAANLIFLRNSGATHAPIRDALTSLATRAGAESTVIFYFQGHGGRKLF